MPENSDPNALKMPENTAAPTKHPAKTHLWEVFMPSPHPHDACKSPKWKVVDRLYLSWTLAPPIQEQQHAAAAACR
ncbi:Protein of unknown function [Pyronema omphalodes CBS 100304]|uniref:Uncharacterized protein n=1 Tax=Pyronema omphalodes (strain CBS 100304) TaxID=1076935 RepID=U4KXA1_PYROM|nr:Protein of unknown function [Pyronema omphalodes CBS 100304]